jgi:hypothetical protein
MGYKSNIKNENPLWRNYVENIDMNNSRWLKEVEITIPLPKVLLQLESKNYCIYLEEEFLEKLKTDDEFNNKWGN